MVRWQGWGIQEGWGGGRRVGRGAIAGGWRQVWTVGEGGDGDGGALRAEGCQFFCLLRRFVGSAGGLSLYWGFTLGWLYFPCCYDGVERLEYETSSLLYLLVGGEAAKAEADGGVEVGLEGGER